jgi:hypothetical protein
MTPRHVAWFRFKDGLTADQINEHLAHAAHSSSVYQRFNTLSADRT